MLIIDPHIRPLSSTLLAQLSLQNVQLPKTQKSPQAAHIIKPYLVQPHQVMQSVPLIQQTQNRLPLSAIQTCPVFKNVQVLQSVPLNPSSSFRNITFAEQQPSPRYYNVNPSRSISPIQSTPRMNVSHSIHATPRMISPQMISAEKQTPNPSPSAFYFPCYSGQKTPPFTGSHSNNNSHNSSFIFPLSQNVSTARSLSSHNPQFGFTTFLKNTNENYQREGFDSFNNSARVSPNNSIRIQPNNNNSTRIAFEDKTVQYSQKQSILSSHNKLSWPKQHQLIFSKTSLPNQYKQLNQRDQIQNISYLSKPDLHNDQAIMCPSQSIQSRNQFPHKQTQYYNNNSRSIIDSSQNTRQMNNSSINEQSITLIRNPPTPQIHLIKNRSMPCDLFKLPQKQLQQQKRSLQQKQHNQPSYHSIQSPKQPANQLPNFFSKKMARHPKFLSINSSNLNGSISKINVRNESLSPSHAENTIRINQLQPSPSPIMRLPYKILKPIQMTLLPKITANSSQQISPVIHTQNKSFIDVGTPINPFASAFSPKHSCSQSGQLPYMQIYNPPSSQLFSHLLYQQENNSIAKPEIQPENIKFKGIPVQQIIQEESDMSVTNSNHPNQMNSIHQNQKSERSEESLRYNFDDRDVAQQKDSETQFNPLYDKNCTFEADSSQLLEHAYLFRTDQLKQSNNCGKFADISSNYSEILGKTNQTSTPLQVDLHQQSPNNQSNFEINQPREKQSAYYQLDKSEQLDNFKIGESVILPKELNQAQMNDLDALIKQILQKSKQNKQIY